MNIYVYIYTDGKTVKYFTGSGNPISRPKTTSPGARSISDISSPRPARAPVRRERQIAGLGDAPEPRARPGTDSGTGKTNAAAGFGRTSRRNGLVGGLVNAALVARM